ncbi:Lytic transglycosylase catalytic (plasmid) [Deinococcus proteolyticus MRP]|uniref:Lytic transglycosylase catalytic n=1 Tax=Deinococcus proteolyticus (strain ATCC 35074 / DSM 20540 / JCM 6276 / NBRC 101906 / NCIMB 13154 / VKM Ac-1939 / CCM 2703 / MRP) TaxID=693977 RepID=F0RQ18_DEIPM|nr:lytic transglycosylase domain-containing protein [Deinococcus proteolyticus]ADY27220.1 Lytic transglycosylase catalytic [Deinococcus proteolyticus MRP]
MRWMVGLLTAGLVALGGAQAQTATTPGQVAPVQRGWNSCAPHERGQLVYSAGRRQILIPQEYSTWLRQYAQAEGVPATLLFSLVWHESGFCQNAISHAGAVGLGQLMPATARGLGVNPYNAQQNLWGTARYLRQQYQRFGRIELALAAYNAGPGRVAACGCVPEITETRNYVNNIVRMYRSFG